MSRRRHSLCRPVSCNRVYIYIYTYISVRVLCLLIVSCLLCCRLCSLRPSVLLRVRVRLSFFLSLPPFSPIPPSKTPMVPPCSPRTRVTTRQRAKSCAVLRILPPRSPDSLVQDPRGPVRLLRIRKDNLDNVVAEDEVLPVCDQSPSPLSLVSTPTQEVASASWKTHVLPAGLRGVVCVLVGVCVCLAHTDSPVVILVKQSFVLFIVRASWLSFSDSVLAAKSWFRIAFPLVRLFLGSGPLRSHLGSFCACRLTRQRTFTWEGARGMHTVVRGTTLRACTRRSCSG